MRYGADQVLQREYGPYVITPEPEYNFSLQFDTESVSSLSAEEKTLLIRNVSLLKRNVMAAPFERAFQEQANLQKDYESKAPEGVAGTVEAPTPQPSELMQIHYRDEEAIYVQAQHDRVTVIFSTVFKDETDRVYGKVFLQEFVDARRRPAIQNAPQVLYSNREPPLEIRHVGGLKDSEDVGYVTFVLFPRHFSALTAAETISRIQIFRDYLHYHIKCSKAYMHSRMRARVAEFLKVLNRAKPENAEKERKTATGRTFRQR